MGKYTIENRGTETIQVWWFLPSDHIESRYFGSRHAAEQWIERREQDEAWDRADRLLGID